jgi:nucleoside-triphosphatase THEP1
VSGFYTDEVLDGNGRRIGFDIVGIASKKRGVLSRKSGLPSNFPKTGQYSVDVASFEDIALVELDIIESQTSSAVTTDGNDVTDDNRTSQIIIIDEIGRMELHSTKFQAAVEKLLHQPHVMVVGAITSAIYGHRVPFCDYITDGYKQKKHPMPVEVMRIKQSTRESVTLEYLQRLDALLLKSLEGDRKRRRRRE